MSEDNQDIPEIVKNNRFVLFIIGSVIVALLLLFAALGLYNSSGVAQLDFTRPGYETIRSEIKDNSSYKGFNASGTLDQASLDEFDKLYSEKLKEAQSVDAFGNDVLSFKTLKIDAESSQKIIGTQAR